MPPRPGKSCRRCPGKARASPAAERATLQLCDRASRNGGESLGSCPAASRAQGDRLLDDGGLDADELTFASGIEIRECGGALGAGVPHDRVGESLGVDEHPASVLVQLEVRGSADVHTVEESVDAQSLGAVLDERAILAAIARAAKADDLGAGDVADAKVGV